MFDFDLQEEAGNTNEKPWKLDVDSPKNDQWLIFTRFLKQIE